MLIKKACLVNGKVDNILDHCYISYQLMNGTQLHHFLVLGDSAKSLPHYIIIPCFQEFLNNCF